MAILLFKALHIIGFVAWFSGLFYMGRMFVYHAEAFQKEEPEQSILIKQLSLMESRVYKMIMNPAMMITWTAGLTMIFLYGWEWFTVNTWLHVKLVLLFFLSGYHTKCKQIMKELGQKKLTMNSFRFRLFNEVPTIILFLIVELAVLKMRAFPNYLLITFLLLLPLLYLGTVQHKKKRIREGEKADGDQS